MARAATAMAASPLSACWLASGDLDIFSQLNGFNGIEEKTVQVSAGLMWHT
jgi:hypothetical protein